MARLVETLRKPPNHATTCVTTRGRDAHELARGWPGHAAWSVSRESIRTRWQAWPGWCPLAMVLAAGALLRLAPWLAAYPLHRDEALYGAWARAIASGSDPWLLASWVDKPPLALYLLAGSLRMWGVSDLALRGPAMLASLLTVGATYGLARQMAARPVALLAAGLVAFSPFAILFAPTAFTDPWLTLWLALAAWAALARRPFWAGLALGLAVASKQNGVLAAPLVLALLWLPGGRAASGARRQAPFGMRACVAPALWCLLGFGLAFGPVYWWDTLRWAKRPSFWDRSLQTYGGLYLAAAADWGERAARWAAQAGCLWGAPILSGAVFILAGLGAYGAAQRRQAAPVVLAAYTLGYLLVHWLVTFQPWDRYLLPLAPLLAILAALGIARLWEDLPRARPAQRGRLNRFQGEIPALRGSPSAQPPCGTPVACRSHLGLSLVVIAATVLLLAWPAWLGATGRVPVGSDHYAFTGLDQIVATLQRLPGQSVIYHRSLGWHLDYYLFSRPQPRVWWAEPETLAGAAHDMALWEPGRSQWLAIAWAADASVMDGAVAALRRRGLRLEERQRVYRPDNTLSFTLFEILPQERAR